MRCTLIAPFLALATILFCDGSHADTLTYMKPPPAQYDHAYRGPGKLLVVRQPMKAVRFACRAPLYVLRLECAYLDADGCTVFMPTKGFLSASDDARLLRHAIAHCNGWPADHSQAPRTIRAVEARQQ